VPIDMPVRVMRECGCLTGNVRAAGDTEVREYRVPVLKEDILRFDVPGG